MNLHTSPIVQLMAHKKWMDIGLYDALQSPAYASKPDAIQQALYWLNHIHIVDQIFRSHMLGQPHSFTSTESSSFPPLTELRREAEALDDWLFQYAQELDAAAGEIINFVFTDGDHGCMSRSQMLMHLASHGLYHISVTTHELILQGLPTPPLLLTTCLNNEAKVEIAR
ncbi:DinB family protein [Citrobacter koseri]|uniref:DinB family protein n=1 Tax=Citrobacter koseri TaxID=545 RepID=UPI002B3A7F39|nr:DinB family protein [Citrobacter koseri]MEB2704021.1 DinB family protein [Citrobacter koseri]MEB2709598.1 DinB family protein [Citrobacter koseri]